MRAFAGELKVPIAHVFALEDTFAALERLRFGNVQGKIVLDCRRP
jgi:NADPH:quinone reductase-like Zn-dependent oxidoreductase